MNKYFLIVLAAILLVSGCGFNSGPKSDFEPQKGAFETQEDMEDFATNAFNKRLMTAYSYDGLEYLPTDDGWITDQANTPDVVQNSDGDIYLYFKGWIAGGEQDKTSVAISPDQGQTWYFKHLNVTDLPNNIDPSYPDVILLDDGTFRLYFSTTNPDGYFGIYYAEGSDGVNFTFKGDVAAPPNTSISNSTTFKVQDEWHMYAMVNDEDGILWHLLSDNGTYWEITEITSFPIDGTYQIPSNGVWLDGVFHMFMSDPDSGEVRSQSTTDGYNWTVEDGTRIGPLEDGRFVKDPTILELDNSHLMIYVTTIPE